MAKEKKAGIYQVDSFLHVPAAMDLGNFQCKGFVNGIEWIANSNLVVKPKGDFDKEFQPEYYEFDKIDSFALGDLAANHQGAYAIGDNPKENKTFANPYFLIGMLADTIPQIITTSDKLTVRPLVFISLQDRDWAEDTLKSFDYLPDALEITRHGKTFVLDIDYLKTNIQFRQEGFAIARICAMKKKHNKPVLLFDVGGRTVHGTKNDAQGYSANNTLTLDSSGVLSFYEYLLKTKKFSGCFSKGLEVNASDISKWIMLGNNKKLNQVVADNIHSWLNKKEFNPIWLRIESELRSEHIIIFAGGGSGLPGFIEAVNQILDEKDLSENSDKFVFAQDLMKCPAHLANAKSLFLVAKSKLDARF